MRTTVSFERGASMVEFALVISIFLIMVLGMIDFGLVMQDGQALQEGVRSASRNAVVGRVGADVSCPTASLSGLVGTDTRALICDTKESVASVGVDPADVRVKVLFTDHVEGNPFVLCAMAPADSLTGFFEGLLVDDVLAARVEMRTENTETATLEAVEEATLDGQDWLWCTA